MKEWKKELKSSFNPKFRKLEIKCWFYDAKPTDKKRQDILLFCLDEYGFDAEMLHILNTILKIEEGGYQLIQLLYKEMGLDYTDIDDMSENK